jgi:Sec-independent protein translocase protein TatA
MIVAMGATGDDEERTGYGARRGWRAPKGAGPGRAGGRRRSRGRDDRGTHPRVSPATDATPAPGTLAARIARLSRLPPEDAAELAREDLPAPGAPDALPAAFRALGRLLIAARDAAETARRQAEETAERRARDAARARTQVARAQEREIRQREKASAEQGERQRLAGELERTQARLSQVAAERDRLRAPGADGPARPGDPGHDDAEVAGLLARVFELEAQLEERAVALEQLTDAREAAEAERDHLVTSARRLRRLALEAGATDVDLVDPEDAAPLRADELPEVRTVLQAVELAAAHAEHLIYTDRAFSSARTAPYTEPQKLLRDLVALDRVAAAWDIETGIGRPIRDVALEQQLDWADDVSDTARGQNAREYQFSHQGRPLWAGPHVRVATGRGLQRTCRVYLALVKGTEPDLAGLPRGVYVGPVGRHLSDSTSG